MLPLSFIILVSNFISEQKRTLEHPKFQDILTSQLLTLFGGSN